MRACLPCLAALLWGLSSACTFSPPSFGGADAVTVVPTDASEPDAQAQPDTGARLDAGAPDAQAPDAQAPDAGVMDAMPEDASPMDTGPVDMGTPDGGTPDTGPPDAGTPDSGPPDAGVFICGDGRIEGTEQCDDDNFLPNDGCTGCMIDPGWVCVLMPSRCTDGPLVEYVDAANPNCDDGDDENGEPWCEINDALSEDPELIIVSPGRYQEALVIDSNTEVLLHAPQGATISDSGGSVLVRSGGRAIVSGFVIEGGVKVEHNDSELTLWDNVIGPSPRKGIDAKNGTVLTMARNLVINNDEGGIYLDSDRGYTIVNNVIVSNGGGNRADFGGVRIKRTNLTARFANNSISLNVVMGQPGGIRCDMVAQVRNTIVWGNTGNAATGISTDCQAQYSLLEAPDTGLGLISADPLFLDPLLHIAPNSPARDVGSILGVQPLGPAPVDDFDRRSRPQGLRVDLGAYEL